MGRLPRLVVWKYSRLFLRVRSISRDFQSSTRRIEGEELLCANESTLEQAFDWFICVSTSLILTVNYVWSKVLKEAFCSIRKPVWAVAVWLKIFFLAVIFQIYRKIFEKNHRKTQKWQICYSVLNGKTLI